MIPTRRIDWYFDFISPFAWLQAEEFARRPALVVACRPVLFAGLLQHWGQLGPAEIAPKREFTYRYTLWRARQLGLPVRLPRAHPFNPLSLLRLAMVAQARFEVVLRLFRFVWSEGNLPDDTSAWQALLAELDLPDAERRLQGEDVKTALRRNGEEAIARGVFGVPTAIADGELFWGADATGMLLDYLAGDPLFESDGMRQAGKLPVAQARRPRH
ncbi:MAG: 2-hydroxychromene-2-carboxylate isomerase [Burkholderiales bacterium]|nr:2-hydroxychromene-2-carboxylate isomerase [Burkholderiales bacterium]